jgi:hypothetical protein
MFHLRCRIHFLLLPFDKISLFYNHIHNIKQRINCYISGCVILSIFLTLLLMSFREAEVLFFWREVFCQIFRILIRSRLCYVSVIAEWSGFRRNQWTYELSEDFLLPIRHCFQTDFCNFRYERIFYGRLSWVQSLRKQTMNVSQVGNRDCPIIFAADTWASWFSILFNLSSQLP